MMASLSSETLQPGIDSSLSRVPPVWPSPRPDSCGTGTPQAATRGASGRVILSPTPPVECLSAVGRESPEKNHSLARRDHRGRPALDLASGHPVEEDGHRQRRHLLLGHHAAGVGVDHPVDLLIGQLAPVALGDDSWVADDGELYHLFVLQSSRLPEGPAGRHVSATIGHATSPDLVNWHYLGECFGPADSGFDDLAIWTGSVVREDNHWRLIYTAVNTDGLHVFDQRIGSAVSEDLHNWTRVSAEPALSPDPRWYKTLAQAPPPFETDRPLAGKSETWRDPLAIADPGGDGWHLLVTARSAHAGRNDDGVIAHAYGPDLDHLELGPPLCEPGAGFGQLEVLQSKIIDGRAVLVFTCHPQEMTEQAKDRLGLYCTWSLPSPGLLGPWDITQARGSSSIPIYSRRRWCSAGTAAG